MELIFGYLAGILTLINPCVLPVLPIVLASSVNAGRHGPLAIAAGMSVSFVSLGMLVATAGHTIGLTETLLAQIGSVLMIGFGLLLLIPQFNTRFALATASISSGADSTISALPTSHLRNHFIGGLLLGAVWSPCIGPTLGGAISLASQGQNLIWAFAIMVSFALGVSSVIVALGYGTGEAIRSRQASLRSLAAKAKPIMGAAFILVGLMIFFKIHHVIEAWLVDVLPVWFQDLSTNF
ncbi:MAG: cytochrome c biogenesis CcdA family protein [Granulosicoccus sp.]|nr:cytochrome c biogenesis CcdA family protein [Granulosicoccus sp.]